MSKITKLHARQVLDSRGNPTIEVDCILEDGSFGRSSVPSGASTGTHEALELRDHDPLVYAGQGEKKAVSNVNVEIANALVAKEASRQNEIDDALVTLDGTPNKSRLGANAILGVSLAVCQASSKSAHLPLYDYIRKAFSLTETEYVLPTPMINLINGGRHAPQSSDFQEYMIVPHQATSFAEALRMSAEVFHALKKNLLNQKKYVGVGDEGGFCPTLESNQAPFEIISQAIKEAGYAPEKDISLATDVASSEFYRDGKYDLTRENITLDRDGMIAYIAKLQQTYPLVSVEDILHEDDWEGWQIATQKLPGMQIVGDDLFVTNPERLTKGIDLRVANSILVKLNQIGTLTETLLTVQIAKKAGYKVIISHRSGETEDTFISDLVVALGTGQIKTGSVSRTERVAKYNQLLRIEEEVGSKARYAGKFIV